MNALATGLCLLLVGLATVLTAPLGTGQHSGHHRPETRKEHQDYFSRFEYCKGNGTNMTDAEFRRCVWKFQKTWPSLLNVTGEMDEATKNLMGTPRCGVPDGDIGPNRRKRYVLYPTKWPTTDLTYYFQDYTKKLPQDVTRSIIKKAFEFWTNVSSLTFRELTSPQPKATIPLFWGEYDHGDGQPFDGPGGVLAHAFFPRFGNTHFDESETWTYNSYSGVNLLQVAVHEIGHALGLEHSNVKDAVMAPYYSGYNPKFHLVPDDISGIQALYGPPLAPPTAQAPSSSSSTSTSKTSSSKSSGSSTTPRIYPAPTPVPRTSVPPPPPPSTTPAVPPPSSTPVVPRPPRRCSWWNRWLGYC